jgi:hypothetical protein
MAEATGISARRLTNVGNLELWEVTATATSTETITLPSNVPATTTSIVQVIACNNVTDGTNLGTITCPYDDGNKRFTYTESGASDEKVRVLFYLEQ